jgi:hypothetical protein
MAAANIPIEKLPDAVLGRDRAYARGEAMAVLAASNHPQREALLAHVLEDPGEQRRYRLVAAITLGRIFTPAAARLLIRNLEREQPALADVLKSLGRIGSREALSAIESLKLGEGHPAHGAAVFAAALISYRLGLAGHDLPLPSEAELLQPRATDARPIDVRKMEAEAASVVIEALKRYPHGIEFDPAAVTGIYCDGEVNVLCVNRDFSGQALARAGERKALLAVAALQSPETGDYSPSYLVLTSPGATPGTFEVVVTRCSGTYALAGTARLGGDRADFQLRSVRRPGARAIVIRGTLADGIIQAVDAVSSATREPPRLARHVVVDRA